MSYEYTTSYGASVPNAAASNWNAVQGKVSLGYSPPTDDILVEDATLPTNVYAGTALYSQACSLCYNDKDICNGACLGSTALYYANVELNASTINGYAAALGVASGTVAAAVLTHEIGHTFQLGDIGVRYGACSEVGSIMMSGGLIDLCGVSTPTSRDVSVFNSIYPSSPGYCPPGQNACYQGDACS